MLLRDLPKEHSLSASTLYRFLRAKGLRRVWIPKP